MDKVVDFELSRWITGASISSDVKFIACVSRMKKFFIIDLQKGTQTGPDVTLDSQAGCIRYSKDNTMVAIGINKTIKIWNANTLAQLNYISYHDAPIVSICFSPDGQYIASGSEKETIRIWKIADQTLQNIITGLKYQVNNVEYSTNGNLLASRSYDQIYLWDTIRHKKLINIGYIKSRRINCIKFSPKDNLIASTYENYAIKVWDVKSRKQITSLRGHKDYIITLSFQRYLASGSGDKQIRIWDITTRKNKVLVQHWNWVHAVQLSTDDSFCVSACMSGYNMKSIN